MLVEIKVPTPGESITEVELGKWLVADGDLVEKDQEIAEIESDKATLTLSASESGKLKILVQEGDRIAVGTIACTVDTSVAGEKKEEQAKAKAPEKIKAEVSKEVKVGFVEPKTTVEPEPTQDLSKVKVTSVAQKMMEEYHLSLEDVINGLQRISKADVEAVVALQKDSPEPVKAVPLVNFANSPRTEKREKMTSLRRKLSERLVAVKNETAMLTTFNEIDMSRAIEMRARFQDKFVAKYGLKLGYMSLFSKAVAEAMKFHPMINAQIDGEDIVTPDFVDIGIAVQTPKGLMVPIIRNCESKSIADIEIALKVLADKARNKKISVEELTGGTFTITNGGTFGSLMSTPIINPPQSAILGMHNIVDRPVAVSGQVVIRPMMYVALSYDHRIIDGKDSVGFLVKVKELVENPERLITGGKNPEEVLLGL
jgi:2-oxoglutarate dehydrogenase E2 component (dihydrolipoamide succinyltransferase)